MIINKNHKIFIAGHNGLVGNAITSLLKRKGYSNLILKSRKELDLLDQESVSKFFTKFQPNIVFVCAAKVGGIYANNIYRGQFIYENLQIQNNIIHQSFLNQVDKLLFLGSSCIYPRDCKQPMKEEYLLAGPLENTNEPYAIAKIAGIKMCESYYSQYNKQFFSIMPTNTYGPNDNYDLETSHVIPALIKKVHEAKINNISEVTIWGSGAPMREFIYVDDLAEAALFVIQSNFKDLYSKGISHLNVGSGLDISIKDLTLLIVEILEYNGKIVFDRSKPDGTPRKLMDSSRINTLGWVPKFSIREGIEMTYSSYLKNNKN